METGRGFNEQCITFSQMNLITNSRQIWRTITAWSRANLISRYAGVGTKEALFAKLYDEFSHYGEMLRLIFGAEFAENFTWLLNEYIIALRELVTAQQEENQEEVARTLERMYRNAAERARLLAQANPFWDDGADAIEAHMPLFYRWIELITLLITAQIEGNVDAVNEITRLLYANAEEIALFLASINPFWDETELRNSLFRHLRDMIEESTSLLTGEYDRSIDIMAYAMRRSESTGYHLALGLYRFITNIENVA